MIITNGVVVTVKDHKNDLETLHTFMDDLFSSWNETKDLSLEKDDYYQEKPYIGYRLPEGMPITFPQEMGAQLRAIQEDVFKKPGTTLLPDVRYTFNVEEMERFADRWPELIDEIEKKKADLKSLQKEYKKAIDELQTEFEEITENRRLGYMERDVECRKVLDFNDRVVKYYSVENDELILTEDMTAEEAQMQIELDV